MPELLGAAKVADEQLKAAFAQLQGMTVGKTDPNYGPALEAVRRAYAAVVGADPVTGTPYAPEYTGLPLELEALQTGLLEDLDNTQHVTDHLESTLIHLDEFAKAAERLSKGLYRIQAGGKKLADGAAQLSDAAQNVGDGLDRLTGGATALVAGIDELSGGAEALETGLSEAVDRSAPLQSGLERAGVRVISGKAQIKKQVRRVRRATPGLFNSGYFVLSELDGANASAREVVGGTIDLNSGQAASMTVISKYSFNTPGSIALNKRLEQEAREFSDEAGLATGVAGGVAQLNEFSSVTRDRIPLIVAVITLVTFLILVVVLRSIPLAAIAVALNLSTVGVAFGVLTLLFNVPAGAPGRQLLRRRGHRGDDLRRRLRALDRLRGLPPQPDARALRPARRQRRGNHLRPRQDRAGYHRRGGDHDGRLRRLRHRLHRRPQPAGHRPHDRGPARRHGRAHRPPAGADAADRGPRLVAAPQPRADPPQVRRLS